MTQIDGQSRRARKPLGSSDGFVNTLMIQNVLVEPEWASVLGEADQRGITRCAHEHDALKRYSAKSLSTGQRAQDQCSS
jgi:hypothetical protein